MLDPTLLPRIQTHLTRFEEIETLLGDPAVASDQARFVKLTKEYKHLRRIVELMKAYNAEVDNIDFYREVIDTDPDPDSVADARRGLASAEEAIAKI